MNNEKITYKEIIEKLEILNLNPVSRVLIEKHQDLIDTRTIGVDFYCPPMMRYMYQDLMECFFAGHGLKIEYWPIESVMRIEIPENVSYENHSAILHPEILS